MGRDSERLSALRTALGRQLAVLRKSAGLTQAQLARRTGYSRSSVAHIETGQQIPGREFWRRVDDTVDADGALTRAYAGLVAAQSHQEEHQLSHLAEPGRGDDDMRRRELLQLLSGTAAAAFVTSIADYLNVDELERVVRAIDEPGKVDERVIENLNEINLHCRLQKEFLGPGAVLATAISQRDLASRLLPGCPPALRPNLLSTFSRLSTTVGGCFAGLDDTPSAVRYYEHARKAAYDARDANLEISALCSMSSSAAWKNRHHAVIDLAAAIRNRIHLADDPQLKAHAAERIAHAHAIEGRHRACLSQLETARKYLSVPTRYPESPARFYDETQICRGESASLLQLGRPREAVSRANDSLTLIDPTRSDTYAYCTLRLSTAHLQCRDMDEAARILGNTAEIAAKNRSARLLNTILEVRHQMTAWENTKPVTMLDEKLAAHLLV